MQFDPENKVIKLCAEGMQAEAVGNVDFAHSLFQQAWEIAENDFEAFTAAHYLARNQKDPNDVLSWNLEALTRAVRINDESVQAYFPSLYLNIGKSYEGLNNLKAAENYYQQAAETSDFLPPGPYGDMIRTGIANGLNRAGANKLRDEKLDELIAAWCERKALQPLGMVLPAYISNLGTVADREKIVDALSRLSAARCVNDDEQKIIDEVIATLSADTGE